jgi:hypothetical protein
MAPFEFRSGFRFFGCPTLRGVGEGWVLVLRFSRLPAGFPESFRHRQQVKPIPPFAKTAKSGDPRNLKHNSGMELLALDQPSICDTEDAKKEGWATRPPARDVRNGVPRYSGRSRRDREGEMKENEGSHG